MRAYSAIAVAKRFLDLAKTEGVGLSNMKLQKLVFFSQVLSMKMFNAPIHCNDSLAWDFGPVVRELYDLVHDLAAKRPDRQLSLNEPDVSAAFDNAENIDDNDALSVIQAVWDQFKNWTAMQLSNLTHRPNSPWATVYSRERYAVIPNDLIAAKGFGSANANPF